MLLETFRICPNMTLINIWPLPHVDIWWIPLPLYVNVVYERSFTWYRVEDQFVLTKIDCFGQFVLTKIE